MTALGPIPEDQYYPRDFSVFVLNDAIAFPDVEGSVAAGGQFTASSFSLARLAPYWTALVAGGQVTVQNGTINGSIYSPNLTPFDFSTRYTLDTVTVSFGASRPSSPTSPINFSDAFVKLRNMSQALKRYPISPSASVTTTNGGTGLDIVSNEKELNVVALPASQLNGMRSINLSVPTGSPLIVNVTGGTDVTFQSMQVTSNASILWNFPDTTTSILMTEGVLFRGSILAPDADVRFDWGGMILGTLVAKSASPLYTATGASFEMHLAPFSWTITYSAPSQTIYQIDCGSGSGVAPFGPDKYFSGGTAYAVTNAITTTGVTKPAPGGVHQSERYGNTTYTLPSLVPGTQYTVRLHFAETYWTAKEKRKFNVTINGTAVLSNLDIYATTGARYKAMVREFTANANSSGQIVLKFVTVTNNATIGGIELIK